MLPPGHAFSSSQVQMMEVLSSRPRQNHWSPDKSLQDAPGPLCIASLAAYRSDETDPESLDQSWQQMHQDVALQIRPVLMRLYQPCLDVQKLHVIQDSASVQSHRLTDAISLTWHRLAQHLDSWSSSFWNSYVQSGEVGSKYVERSMPCACIGQ